MSAGGGRCPEEGRARGGRHCAASPGSERRPHWPAPASPSRAAPHLGCQQARGRAARPPLLGGLLGPVPEPARRVRQRAGRWLRPSHLLQDTPQLLGVQRSQAHGAVAPAGKSRATTADVPGLRFRARHGGLRGTRTRVACSGGADVRHPVKGGTYECSAGQNISGLEAGLILDCRHLADAATASPLMF